MYHVEEWTPMAREAAGTGRNMGGPVTQLACRLYCLYGQPWPRLRLSAFPAPGGVEVSAWMKEADDPSLGWDKVEVPGHLWLDALMLREKAERLR